jgi:meso-butanediol dehydrogenase/(S,S)-butanediol dehydrogenase/diacetyl reductase
MSMNGLLGDHVVIVTGGANGIGLECARAYAREGAHVVIADLDGDTARAVAAELPGGPLGLECDVSIRTEVETLVRDVLMRHGRIDAVHNNAGISTPARPLHETSDAEWERLFAINLKSVHNTTVAALPSLRASRGAILNTASLVGQIGQANHAAYAATKGAMIALTKSMALDYAQDGVRVNAICPAGVWTPLLREWVAEQPDPAEVTEYLDAIHPLGPCPEGDVIADVAVFLLSARARFMTGAVLPVSGGAELGYRR